MKKFEKGLKRKMMAVAARVARHPDLVALDNLAAGLTYPGRAEDVHRAGELHSIYPILFPDR